MPTYGVGHTEASKAKMSRTRIERGLAKGCKNPSFGKDKTGKNNPNYRGGKIKKNCLVCNREYLVIIANHKNGRSKFCSRNCLGVFTVKHVPRRDTLIERLVEEELTERGIEFEKQVMIPIARTCVDFMIGTGTIIYCDGDYWHSLEKTRERDLKQTKILQENGYKVFRLKERDIKQNVSLCMNNILV